MAGLQSCHTWLFVQQGHCSIPLMHGAVGDARCAVRQRATSCGGRRPSFGRRAVGDAWWATPPTWKRGWSVRLSALCCLAGHAACPHWRSPTHLVVIPEQIMEKWRPTFRFISAIGEETSLFSTNQQNNL